MKERLLDLWISIKDFFGGILVLLFLAIPFLLELLGAFYTPRTPIFMWQGFALLVILIVAGVCALRKKRRSAKFPSKEEPS